MVKEWLVYGIKYQEKIMYIGISSNFKKRIEQHKYSRWTSHSAIPITVDYHDTVFITFEKYVEKNDALLEEDKLIKKYDTINNGWNKNRSGLIETTDKAVYMKCYQKQYYKTDENIQKRRKNQLEYYYKHKAYINKKRVERRKK